MAHMVTWERMLDDWMARTDMSTVLMEHACAACAEGDDDGDTARAMMAFGRYLGACDAIATLAMVPVEVVWSRVRLMSGAEEVA